MSTTLLAIETSQHCGGLALRGQQGRVDVEMLCPKKRHDDDLMPAIDRIMRRSGLGPRQLEAVAVSIGPGGFTGLRIAVAAARMLAETLTVKLVAAPSALVAAESYARPGPIIVGLAAKGDTFWCTRCARDATGAWHIAAQPGVTDAASLELGGIQAVIGDQHLPAGLQERCRAAGVPVVEPTFEPRACLEVADRMLARGETVDPLRLLPTYPRPPEAVSIWEQRQA